MYEIKIKSDIASAHFLRGYEGSCKNLHGHTWKIEVTVVNSGLNHMGMVADFRVLKKTLKDVLDPLDHVNLNDLSAFQSENPTAENLAKHIYHEFARTVAPLRVKSVEVWESDMASAVYYE